MADFDASVPGIDPDELVRRMAAVGRGLQPASLAPVARADMPAPAMPTDPRMSRPISPSLAPASQPGVPLPDYNDPKYHPANRSGLGADLKAFGVGLVGGYPAMHDYLTEPTIKANTQFEKDRQAAIDTSEIQDRASQSAQRDETATLDAAKAEKELQTPAAGKMRPAIIEGENGDPRAVAFDPDKGVYVDPDTQQPIADAKPFQKAAAPKTPSEEEQSVSDHLAAKGMANTPANRDSARRELKLQDRVTPDKSDARSDRSYQFNSTQLEKERAPVEAQMSKISAATTNVDLKSPQADALLAPQILSLSAGGSGSGLRMNEAEISRILGGRTAWESLKAAVNKYSTDPTHPQIPDAQRAQMVQILQAAQAKGVQKQQVLEWAEGKLVDADDPKEHRQTVQQARQFLDAIDSGKRIQRNKNTGELRIAADQ